jgi:CubicO group peptidase (beta-lactamase class C family)
MEGFGSFRSTVGDLLTFISANLGQTETALLPAMKLTHLKHRSAENRFIPGWVGLGWQIIDNHGTLVLDHSGETWGYVSYVGFIEYARVGVVVLANFLDGTVQIKGFRLLERLAEQFGD